MSNRFSRVVAAIAAVALIVAGCAGGAAASDPYELLTASSKAGWDPLQVNVGFAIKDGSTSVTIEPSAIAFVFDAAGEKGAFHMALPAAGLGVPPLALAQLGISGDTIDFDLIYDGQGLFGKSPLFPQMLQLFLGPTGQVPSGDLGGWLSFGTKEDFAGLGGLAGGSGSLPSAAPAASIDAASVKADLEAMGISLSTAAAEKRNGVDANHITVAIDGTKMLASPAFKNGGTAAQVEQLAAALKQFTLSGDVWLDKATSRILELDVHLKGTKDAAQTADVTVTFHDPDGSVSLAAPPSSVKVPLDALITRVMQLVGRGADS